MVDCLSTYNVILGRPTLNKTRAIISIACLTMKVFTDKVKIATTRADQAVARRCYNASMEIQKPKKGEFENCSRPPSLSKVMVIDLDARG